MSVPPKKKQYTDAERLELAARLDKELDDYINSLEKKPYTDGWPEDRWEEEMEKHPFFMTKAPEQGSALNPLYEGLQQLKYDPDENTPEELANNYKEDGNYNFKYKNYRLAVISYTEGLKTKCGNKEIEATLYNNRSAANFFLKNYRSSLRDCKSALKLKPGYEKALARAAHCCHEMGNYKEAIEYCDEILSKQENGEVQEFRKRCVAAAKKKERDTRLKGKEETKKTKERELLIMAIKERGLRVSKGDSQLKWYDLTPDMPQLQEHPVHIDADGKLVWPVAFLYPEYKIMDFVQEFGEDETFSQHLAVMFECRPEWDGEKKYEIGAINLYFKNHEEGRVYKVDAGQTLGEVLKRKELVIQSGTPAFLLVVKNSEAEKQLIKEHEPK